METKAAVVKNKFKSAVNKEEVQGVTQSAQWKQPLKRHIDPATNQVGFVTILVRVLSGDAEKDFHARFPPSPLLAKNVCKAIAEKERLNEAERGLFSLWVISKDLELQMKPDQDIFKLMTVWHRWLESEDPQHQINRHWFIYRREAAVTLKQESQYAGFEAVNLLFGEAKRNILTKRYCCTQLEASTVAGYQLQMSYGDYDVKKCPPGYLLEEDRLVQLLPIGAVGKLRPTQWEEIITVQYKSFLGLSNAECRKGFLEFAQHMTCYGSSFFPTCKELPPSGYFEFRTQNWFVGVGANGVCVIDSDIQKYVWHFEWSEVSCRTEKDLVVLTRTKANKVKVVTLISPQAKLIENLILQIQYRMAKEAGKIKTVHASEQNNIIKSSESSPTPTSFSQAPYLVKGPKMEEVVVEKPKAKEPTEEKHLVVEIMAEPIAIVELAAPPAVVKASPVPEEVVVPMTPTAPSAPRAMGRAPGRPKFRKQGSDTETRLLAELDAPVVSFPKVEETIGSREALDGVGDMTASPNSMDHQKSSSAGRDSTGSRPQSRFGKVGRQQPSVSPVPSLSKKSLVPTISENPEKPVLSEKPSPLAIQNSSAYLQPQDSPKSDSLKSRRTSVFGTSVHSSTPKKNHQSIFGAEGLQINRRGANMFNLDENLGGVGPTELIDMRFEEPEN